MYIGGAFSHLFFHQSILRECISSTVSLVSQGRLFSKAILNVFQVFVTNTSQKIKLFLHRYNSDAINFHLIIQSATFIIRAVLTGQLSAIVLNGSSM